MTEQQVKDYFTANLDGGITRGDIISVHAVERAANIPKGALYDFLNGKKYCHINKHLESITNVLSFLGL